MTLKNFNPFFSAFPTTMRTKTDKNAKTGKIGLFWLFYINPLRTDGYYSDHPYQVIGSKQKVGLMSTFDVETFHVFLVVHVVAKRAKNLSQGAFTRI